jgi:hypothetical protein
MDQIKQNCMKLLYIFDYFVSSANVFNYFSVFETVTDTRLFSARSAATKICSEMRVFRGLGFILRLFLATVGVKSKGAYSQNDVLSYFHHIL